MAKSKRNPKSNGKARSPRKFGPAGDMTLEELARAQGKELRPWTDEDFERLAELGRGLWKNDKEFEDFLTGIYERRQNSGS